VREVLMQSKLCMFTLNSFEHACLTYVYVTSTRTVSDVSKRRPSFHPTKLRVGFVVHTVKVRCYFDVITSLVSMDRGTLAEEM
jgi:hypothetical protein